jgi:hypothetical protein
MIAQGASPSVEMPTALASSREFNETRYDSRGIRGLYDHPEYPFPHLAKVA